MSALESSYQIAVQEHVVAEPHAPFYGWEEAAGKEVHKPDHTTMWYPVSNDLSAHHYVEMAERAADPDFQAARHRVAVVVGEASLMAALPHIPEETVMVLDWAPAATGYMNEYRDALRWSSGAADWRETMVNYYDGQNFMAAPYMGSAALKMLWDDQIATWETAGMTHPLAHPTHFEQAQQAAQEKAIIPYRVDVGNPAEMARLGQILTQSDSTVTFLNYTNIIQYSKQPVSRITAPLDSLPLADQAPILTTSIHAPANNLPGIPLSSYPPFHGLADLQANYPDEPVLHRAS